MHPIHPFHPTHPTHPLFYRTTALDVQHKIDGVLIDGCASAAITGGGGSPHRGGSRGSSRFSILDCQCTNGNPFPLACSPTAAACPADGNATNGAWPWRHGVGGSFAPGRCQCA